MTHTENARYAEKFAELRSLTEEVLFDLPIDPEDYTRDEQKQLISGLQERHVTIQRLVQELQEYQLTLEGDNSELRKAKQELEGAVSTRDHVFRLISHDLKNPLTLIQGHVQLMQRRVARIDPESADKPYYEVNLQGIEEAVTRMMAQIDELLDVAHLQARRPLDLDLETVNLVDLINEAVSARHQVSRQHTIRVETDLERCICKCDRTRFKRVLDNLLINAVKYSPRGGDVVISLAIAESEDHAQPMAVLKIHDHGIGIPTEDLPRVFDPFHRASNVPRSISGTGLGLASVRRIVEQHRGSITVVSELGVGSSFVVRLPVVEAS